MDLVLDSLFLFGPASLGGTLGLIIGSVTQRRRHVRWALAWMLGGFAAGAATALPDWTAFAATVLLLLPAAVGAGAGLVIGAATLGQREDWYIRGWGWAGFVAGFHIAAVGAVAAVNTIS